MDCIYSGRGSPLGIEPYLRDQRTTHFLILWGFEVPSTSSSLGKAQISLALLSLVRQFKAVRKTFQPPSCIGCA